MNNRTFPIVVLSALVSGVASALCVVALTPASPAPVPATDRFVDLDAILSRLVDLGRLQEDLAERMVALHSRRVAEDREAEGEQVELATSVPVRLRLPVAAVAPGAVARDVPTTRHTHTPHASSSRIGPRSIMSIR